MSETYEQNASQIMNKCSQALFKEPYINASDFAYTEPVQPVLKKDQFKELFASALNSCISPHEELENNKIIEKLRKKNSKKKELKEVVIRKTDLGQNELIFTKQELDKLKQIDQQELYGIPSNSPENAALIQNIINGVGVGEQANKKYFGTATPQNASEEINNYLEWVDLKELKKSKDKKKSKILNFQKRERSPSNSIDAQSKMSKNPLPTLMQKFSSPVVRSATMKGLELTKCKSSYPLAKKSQADKGFLNSINVNESEEKREGEREKLGEIVEKVNQHIEREYDSCQGAKKYIYMTEDRKQALYECEREIGPKFYENLQLSYGNRIVQPKNDEDEMDYEKQNNDKNELAMTKNSSRAPKLKKSQSNMGMMGKEKNYTGHKDKMVFETEADRMIHKNRNRLKEQRKRVIERIVC